MKNILLSFNKGNSYYDYDADAIHLALAAQVMCLFDPNIFFGWI